ncbi:hypothetical protein LINPERHAP2_LOCUS11385 [Linum perenne]
MDAALVGIKEGWEEKLLGDDSWIVDCGSKAMVEEIVKRGEWFFRGGKEWRSEVVFRDLGDACGGYLDGQDNDFATVRLKVMIGRPVSTPIFLRVRGVVFEFKDDVAMSRLDRALVSPDWEDEYGGCSLRDLTRTCSDHCPILLECSMDMIILRPWRFEMMWLEFPNFHEVVHSSWGVPVLGSNFLFKLAKRFKLLKEELKQWNRVTFRRNEEVYREIMNKINAFDRQEELQKLSREEMIERGFLKCDLDKLWKREEISWRQKARDKWTKEGEKNTSFFQKKSSNSAQLSASSKALASASLLLHTAPQYNIQYFTTMSFMLLNGHSSS